MTFSNSLPGVFSLVAFFDVHSPPLSHRLLFFSRRFHSTYNVTISLLPSLGTRHLCFSLLFVHDGEIKDTLMTCSLFETSRLMNGIFILCVSSVKLCERIKEFY